MDLLNFQKRFVRGALRADTAALCLPRGNGKSWLAAHVLKRCLTPGDPLNVPGAEYLLAAGSIDLKASPWKPNTARSSTL